MRNVKRQIPEIFIPKRRPKPPKPSKRSEARAVAVEDLQDDPEFRDLDRMMRANRAVGL